MSQRTPKQLENLLRQAELTIERQNQELRRLKSEAAADPLNRPDLDTETLQRFITEYGHLIDATDPTRARNYEQATSRSAEPATEGEATRWLRSRLAETDRDLSRLTHRIQTALSTPAEERTVTDHDGRCITCNRPTRRPRTRTWHADNPEGTDG